MSQHALVNNIDHKDVRVITDRSAKLGDDLWYALTFPNEFRSVQIHYPIFLRKDPQTGQFVSVALFGFQDGENLFLNETGWQAAYIPMSVKRQPFLIANNTRVENGEEVKDRMLCIDMEHPRVSKDQGEPLFLEYGGNSPFLDQTASMLEAMHHGATDGENFCSMLSELDLIEACTFDIQLNDGKKYQMIGFYTINEDKFNTLSNENIIALKEKGYLQAIYMMLASQGNVHHLLAKKNAQL
ncbi:SapC family protein [Thalassotalea euphylliae]|uniref:SapC family protein n=1 Tax=Thalassotalea euphylliae TaxID=1655234 RepID=UPI00363F6849